jgi:hypothetical protein
VCYRQAKRLWKRYRSGGKALKYGNAGWRSTPGASGSYVELLTHGAESSTTLTGSPSRFSREFSVFGYEEGSSCGAKNSIANFPQSSVKGSVSKFRELAALCPVCRVTGCGFYSSGSDFSRFDLAFRPNVSVALRTSAVLLTALSNCSSTAMAAGRTLFEDC